MIATLMILAFMLLTNSMKLNGIRLMKNGKVHGILVIMATKILFWLCIIQISFIWIPNYILFVLPIVFIIFIMYILMEKRLFYETIKSKKEETIL